MKDVKKVAMIHWQLLNALPVAATEIKYALGAVLGTHTGSLIHRLSLDDLEKHTSHLLSNQPTNTTLIRKWKKNFDSYCQTSTHIASQFLFELYTSLEETDSLFHDVAIPGVTHQLANTPGDFLIRRPHTKAGWTLHLTTEGNGTYNCVRQLLTTKPGDLVLLSPDACYDYRRAKNCKHWIHYWFYFLPQSSWFDLLQWPEAGPNIYTLSPSNHYLPKYQSLFLEAINENENRTHLSTRLINNLLENILIRCKQLVPLNNITSNDHQINRVKAYIARKFNEPLSIDMVACEAGMSNRQLSDLFKTHTGTTIKRWRDELRMGKACILLKQSKLAINQIAESVGYEDSLYFSRCFRKYLHCSPKTYRKNNSIFFNTAASETQPM